jgi:hypothetical protein
VRVLATLFVFASLGVHAAPLRVLFVGNSLTYTNDLPATFARIAAAEGHRLETEMIAQPNFSLEDHLNANIGRTLRKKWDVVVLQQGPSSLDESRAQLIRDVKAIAALVRPSTRIAVLMVWPPRARWFALDRVAESHRLAAEAAGGLLIPAGLAMQQELERDPKARLFQEDGFHPAPKGTEIAARVTYQTLFAPGS